MSDPCPSLFLPFFFAGSPHPVRIDNSTKELQEVMNQLNMEREEREDLQKAKESLLQKIDDEKERKDFYKEAILSLKQKLDEETMLKIEAEKARKDLEQKVADMVMKMKATKNVAKKDINALKCEIKRLRNDLKSEMNARIEVENLNWEMEKNRDDLRQMVDMLQLELDEERRARVMEEGETNLANIQ